MEEENSQFKINVSRENPCLARVQAEVPVETVSMKMEDTYAKIQGTAILSGFRRGHAPINLIKQNFEKECRQEVADVLLREIVDSTVEKEKLDGFFRIEIEQFDFPQTGPVTVKLNLHIQPQPELKPYRGLKIDIEEKRITDKEIDEEIERMRDRYAQLSPGSNDVVGEDNFMVVDYQGFDGNGKIEKLSGQNQITSAKNSIFQGKLTGLKKGGTVKMDYRVPDSFPDKTHAGKPCQLEVTVKEIKKRTLPELNDEFARNFNVNTVADLRERVRHALVSAAEIAHKRKIGEKAVELLVDNNDFPVSDYLVQIELDGMIQEAKNASQFPDEKTEEDFRKNWRPRAEKSARAMILLNKIAHQEKLDASKEDIEEEMKSYREITGEPEAKIRRLFEEKEELFRNRIARRKALDFLVENAKISAKQKIS